MANISNVYIVDGSPMFQIGEKFQYLFPVDDEITKEIDSFEKLVKGWDFGKGEVPNSETILNSKLVYLLGSAQGWGAEPHPNTDGSITIILFKEDRFIDVEVKENQLLSIRFEIGKGQVFKSIFKDIELNFSELSTLIIQIDNGWENFLSELSDSTNTAPKKKDSDTTKFFQITKEEFQFSPINVEESKAEQYAII
jgi:hypothetical protein